MNTRPPGEDTCASIWEAYLEGTFSKATVRSAPPQQDFFRLVGGDVTE